MELVRGTWENASEVCTRSPVALVPVGSVENHGPHLPLGTDLMTAEHIAREALSNGRFVLLPPIPIGLSAEHRQFPGTLWVQRETLARYVEEVLRSLASHGVRRAVLVNGHGGNSGALEDVCRTLREERIFAFVFSWWQAIGGLVREICVGSPDHAGDMETSVVLHMDASLVRRARISNAEDAGSPSWGRRENGVSVAFDAADFTRSGATGRPSKATKEKGERLLGAAVSELVSFGTWLLEQDEQALVAPSHVW